jgi:hypothetical protein
MGVIAFGGSLPALIAYEGVSLEGGALAGKAASDLLFIMGGVVGGVQLISGKDLSEVLP